jgi:hypothetical protein
MMLSKHHYSIELAKRGNTVYFLNPPDNLGNKPFISIESSDEIKNLFIIHHTLFFTYKIKYHAVSLFHFLIRFHINKIIKKIGLEIDIVWSFDIENLYPFYLFPRSTFKIYHPMDEPQHKQAIKAANGANLILSVTKEILEKYKVYEANKFLINHGLSSEFFIKRYSDRKSDRIKIGYSGNLRRKDIDWKTVFEIVDNNKGIEFIFFGTYNLEDPAIMQLFKYDNVQLYGKVSTKELAIEFQSIDGFLICYDVALDPSGGTNYHKIIEYLSTGKVVVSNNVKCYEDRSDLVQMPISLDNKDLPGLFKSVINNLDQHNSIELQSIRKTYAFENLYSKQIERINSILKNY